MKRTLFAFLLFLNFSASIAQQQEVTEDFQKRHWSLVKREYIILPDEEMDNVRPFPNDNGWVFILSAQLTSFNYALDFITERCEASLIFFQLNRSVSSAYC